MAQAVRLVTIGAADTAAILALNNTHAVETSWLDTARLSALLAAAWQARMAADASAFLLGFVPDAAYDGANFRWFCARYERFVYVDRVVVAAAARGRGLARALYGEVLARAAAERFALVCCEVNVTPPNPASEAFHAALGFGEVGRAAAPGGKVVRYLVRPLHAVPPQPAAM